MKNKINLNRLSMSWNEKQTPQKFGRYAVMLLMLLTLGVGQMWAAQTYKIIGANGNLDNWSTWKNMTVSTDGFYEYFKVASGDVNCKINTAAAWDGNQMGESYISYNFNCTNLGSGNSWSASPDYNVNFWYNSGAYYIICYYPNTAINTTSSPIICASTSLPRDYAITVATSSSTQGTVSPTSGYATSNGSCGLSITASPKTNFAFVDWSVTSGTATIASTTSASTTVSASAASTVTANFAPQWTLRGGDSDDTDDSDSDAMGNWETLNPFALTSGTTMKCTLALAAKTTYSFKVYDRRNDAWYGNASAFVGQTSSLTMATNVASNCHITTAKAGNYIFTFDNSAKTLTVTYPTETHPTTNYIYFKNTASWGTVYAHMWNDNHSADTYPGPALPTMTFNGSTYYYAAIGSETTVIFGNNNDARKTGDLADANTHTQQYYEYSSSSWKYFTMSISYKDVGNTAFSGTHELSYPTIHTYGSSTTLDSPTKDHYTFDGWFTSSSGTGSSVSTITGTAKSADFTLYAKWTEITHDVKATYGSGGSAATPSGWTAMGELTGGAVTATNATGYHFTGWTILDSKGGSFADASSASTTFYPVANDTWVKANFAPNTYDITLDKNSGDSDGSVTATYNSNTLTSFSGASRTGYTCDGYFDDPDDGEGNMIIDASGNLQSNKSGYTDASGNWTKTTTPTTLYAHWTENVSNYTVTYGVKSDQTSLGTLSCATTIGGSSIDSGDEVAGGTGITFTAAPITGYEVDVWCSNAACSKPIPGAGYANTYSLSLSQDTAVYVKFRKKSYTITYSPSSAPTGCTYTTKPATGTYGNTVTMVFTPTAGYSISVSARDASSNVVSISNPSANTYTFTQPASAVTVTVTVTENKVTLTPTVDYNGGATPATPYTATSANTVGVATTTVLTASTPNAEHYTFAGWTLTNLTVTAGSVASTSVTVKITDPSQAISAVAEYEEVLTTSYVLKGGSAFGGTAWSTEFPLMKKSGASTESVAYYTASLSTTNASGGSTNFNFKIINGANWYGLDGDGDWYYYRTSGQQTMGTSNQNVQICADVAGDYEIKVDYSSTPKITITFPPSLSFTATSVYSGNASTLTASVSNVVSGKTLKYDVYAGATAEGEPVATYSTTTTATTDSHAFSITPSYGASDISKQYTVKITYNGTQTATYTGIIGRKWDIKVNNNCHWPNGVYYYAFGNGENHVWPGVQCVADCGSWYTVTLDGKYPNFVLGNGYENCAKEKTGDLTTSISTYAANSTKEFKFSSEEGDGCGGDGKNKTYTLINASLSAPTVTLTTYDVISTTQIYVEGTVTNYGGAGSQASDMCELGFKIGETKYTTTCTNGNVFKRYITGLTANTEYSVKAYVISPHSTVESSATAHTTRATGSYTIKVRSGVNDPVPYIRAFVYSDESCGGTGITENASGNGVAMTADVTGTVYKWYSYSLSNEYQKFYINENASSTETWDQTAPLTETCYWYHHGAAKNDRFGSMDCPYVTPHLMIEDAPGGTFEYLEMSGSGPYTKTVTLTAKSTYKFKPVYNAEWYGKASTTITRASNSASSLSASVENNLEIETDAAGDYTFTFTAPGTIEVTYPDAHTITFGAGAINGSNSAITVTASPSFTSGDYVLDETAVTFNKGATVAGYDWKGWYSNNDGTGTCHSSADANWTSAADTRSANLSVYACYTYQTYSITYKDQGGSAFSGTQAGAPTSHTYNTATTLKIPTKTGYTFGGWFTASDCASGAVGTASSATLSATGYTANITLYAKWTANTWYVRFNANSGTGSMSNESFTYDAAAKALTANAFTRTGYTYQGWATTAERANAGTVDYADEATVRNLTTTADGIVDLFAVWNANEYTVSFDVNGGTASTPSSRSVTFGAAYGALPTGMTHLSKTFVGWYTDPDDGEGDLITAETLVSTASNHTLYAHYENVYSVNVAFKCGDATIYPSTAVNASPTSLTPTITAPEIFGYSFVNWTGTSVTPADASSATTTITATAATTITANYAVVPTVYFKNNLGWENVYVTFDAYFHGDYENAPGNYERPYYKMTQLGSSDIFYCAIPSSITDSWKGNIAFDNTGFDYATVEETHTGNCPAFNSGEFIGRGDFDQKTTLFIPYSGDTETRNSGTFYKTGCWLKYNSTESGYQVNMNTWVESEHADTLCVKLTAANAGGYEFSATLNLRHPNYSYGFKLYKIYQTNTNDIWYTNTGEITASTETLPWHFWAGSEITATSKRCALHTEALGNYVITVSFATGRPEVDVEYPASVGDWRLAYNDLAAWSNTKHDASWYLYSRVVKAKADAVDTVSFYVNKADSASAHIELQKCTAIDAGTGAETWDKYGENLDLSSVPGTGIYNFEVTQNGSKVASAAAAGAYDGNFYIRTDASDGGWLNYISSGKNLMTYSEYAEENSGFTHYYMRFVTTGSNIKFCIANDYSERLTEDCVSDYYTNEWIEANGNVRFMWDHRTNKVSRAYISGSSIVSDRFLVLEGSSKMYNESGQALTTAGGGKVSGLNDNEMNFGDDQNWIYEATIKAEPKAKALLTAKYNNKIQYFGGSGPTNADSVLLIDGTGTDKYKMRIVYDFKTNRLIKAFIPEGTITAALPINADMMVIREHQGEAQQVQFSGSGALSEVKTVYGAMKFNKYTVNGKEKEGGHAATGDSRYKRDLFYISFPFDVKLSEAFGFGTYGTHWIIEYYDGKGRAEKGFWADSPSNWKFVMPKDRYNFTMNAFEGYILALDLDEMTETSSVWDNGVEDVYVYFPSDGYVSNISATERLVEIDQDGYECTIGPRFAGGDDRRVKDSYWHCIGVPSFANYNRDLSDVKEGGTTIDWRSTSMPYLYEVNWSDNSLDVTSSATFNFKATWSYLVQYAGESIYWSAVNVTPAAGGAPQRNPDAPKDAEYRIELRQNDKMVDQTFVRLSNDEHVTTGFEFNYDLSKEFNKNKANIYTMVTTQMVDGPSITETAGNVLPMSEQTTVVPVGVKIATAGDYTFAIPEGTNGVGVTLIDTETGVSTPLSALDYTINLSAGTYDNRFVMEISPVQEISTDLESSEFSSQNSDVRKVMIDQILYIVKDGVMYDARGARVQ